MDMDSESSNLPPGGRTMNVHYQTYRSRVFVTAASDTTEPWRQQQQPLYTLTASNSREHAITNDRNETVGSVTIHQWKGGIDVRMQNIIDGTDESVFEIRNDKIWGGSPRYTSPRAFEGQKMTWNNKAMSRKIIYTLLDGKGLALARFESNPKTEVGRLEIVEAVGDDVQKINEIVVTLLALLVRKLQSIEAGKVAAVVS